MADDIAERLAAVERAVTEADADLPSLADDAELTRRVDELEREIEELQDRLESLDAALQAVRGYVGSVRSVNEDVEARANTAVAGVESLEERVADLEAARDQGGADAQTARDPYETPSDDSGQVDATTGPGMGAGGLPEGSDHGGRCDRERGDANENAPDQDDAGVVARLRDAL